MARLRVVATEGRARRRPRRPRWLATLLFLVATAPAPAYPWGCEGHETIALLADKYLTPHARKAARDLLDGAPVDPRTQQFCRPSSPSVIAQASTWADDVRGDGTSPFRATGQWHFVNIPRGAAPGDPRHFCRSSTGCILTAIDEQRAALRAGRDQRRRATALRFLIHLVGDLHQPLHTATNNDLGGNCVPVAYLGVEPQRPPDSLEEGFYQPNLHAVWDTHIIRRIIGHRGVAWFADFLDRRFRSQLPAWRAREINLDQWAWESHRAAEQTAYGLLPKPIVAESPERTIACDRVSARMLTLHERLTERYLDAAAPLVEEQLTKAGVRLAVVLNQMWP